MRGSSTRRLCVWALACFCFGFFANRLNAQTLWVDCSGNTPGAYSSIMQAVFNAPSGATLIVSGGTCNEWVYLGNVSNISIGAWWGGRVTIPYLEIAGSRSVYLYGLDVKNGNAWTGIHIGQSQDVMLDTCTSTYSGGLGVNIDSASSVFMFGGQYSNNPGGGINLIQSSYLYLNSTS